MGSPSQLVSIKGSRYFVRPCDSEQGYRAGLYHRASAGHAMRIGEPVYCSPILEGDRKGCVIRWGKRNEAFLAFSKLLQPRAQKGIAASLLALGLRFDLSHAKKLIGYFTECYGSAMETTPKGAFPAKSHPVTPAWALQEVQA